MMVKYTHTNSNLPQSYIFIYIKTIKNEDIMQFYC